MAHAGKTEKQVAEGTWPGFIPSPFHVCQSYVRFHRDAGYAVFLFGGAFEPGGGTIRLYTLWHRCLSGRGVLGGGSDLSYPGGVDGDIPLSACRTIRRVHAPSLSQSA